MTTLCDNCGGIFLPKASKRQRLRWRIEGYKSRLYTLLGFATHPLLKPMQKLLERLPGSVVLPWDDPDLWRAILALDREADMGRYPDFVDTSKLRVVICPWLFKLPWMGYFGAVASRDLILLDYYAGPWTLAHELTHVWQVQQDGRVRMYWEYLTEGYIRSFYESEANAVAATLRPKKPEPIRVWGVDITPTWLYRKNLVKPY